MKRGIFISIIFSFLILMATSVIAGTVDVSHSDPGDGRIFVTVNGTFDTCDGSNSGTVYLYLNGSRLGSSSGSGSASYTRTLDRGSLHGSNTFTGTATDCTGSVSTDYILTLDNTPTVTLTSPTGTVNGPFDITGSASFAPTTSSTKGKIYAYINGSLVSSKSCSTYECSYSYQELTGNLYDLDHGSYTVTLTATGGGASASAEEPFTVDKTPSVSIDAPFGTVSEPFDILGSAMFKPTLDSTKGQISLYINGVYQESKYCSTESCSFSYQEITGHLHDLDHGSYTLKLVATGSGATDTSEAPLEVDKTPTVSMLIPAVGASSPFNIIGSAVFRPTLDTEKGRIQAYVNGSLANTKYCTTEECTFDYEDLAGHLLEYGNKGTKPVTLVATGCGASASEERMIDIDEILSKHWTRFCDMYAKGNSSFNVQTGNIFHDQELFATQGGRLPTVFTLYYNSRDRLDGPLGPGWGYNYGLRLHTNSDGTKVLTGGGIKRFYFPNGTSYTTRTGDFSTLKKNGDSTYQIDFRNGDIYRFDSDGKLTSIEDRYGNAVTVTHSADQDTITDPAGRVTTVSFDPSGHIVSVTDPAQNVYYFDYHADSGMLWKVRYPAGSATAANGVWEYLYTPAGFMEYKIDPEGEIVKYTYDENFRVATSIDPGGVLDVAGNEIPEGHTKTLLYDSPGPGQTTMIEEDGGQWIFAYDAEQGILLSESDPFGSTTSYTYDAEGLVYEKIEPVDASTYYVTTYLYDGYGNPIDVTGHARHDSGGSFVDDPIDMHMQYTYDTYYYDRITSITNLMDNAVTTFSYLDNTDGSVVITMTDPAGNQSVTRTTSAGAVSQVTDGAGRTTTYSYNANGTLASVTSPAGTTVQMSNYTSLGYPQTLEAVGSDSSTQTQTLSYDAIGQLLSSTQAGANPATTSYSYDLNGNRTSVVDPEGNSTGFAFNHEGQPTQITDALLQTTTLQYGGGGCPSCSDGSDKLTALTDAKGQTTSFTYYPTGKLKSETDPLGNTVVYAYTAAGLLSQKMMDANGDGAPDGGDQALVSYSYADNGQLLSKTDHVTGETTSFSYYPNGRLHTAGNAAISYTFEYLANGWLKKVTDSNGRVISYDQYNGAGQKEQVTYQPGTVDEKVMGYSYDTAGRLSTLTSAAGTFTFGYDARSRRSSLSYPNGVVGSYSYDPDRNWLTGIDYRDSGGLDLLNIAYPQHDLVGNRLQKSEDGTPTSYGYDSVYQLTSAATSSTTEAFTFDAVGNRLSGPEGTETYSHDAANRLLSGSQGSYTYDSRGNQISRTVANGVWTLTWNGENQLIEASKTGTTVTFKYDPFGRRVEKAVTDTTGTTTHTYVYDGEDIAFEYVATSTGTVVSHFVHGPGIDEPLALEREGQSFFYHADGLGSVVALTDSTQATVQSYSYDSFGGSTATGSIDQPYGFTGRELDSETGLMYYRARYYDLAEGRWISMDPIGFLAGDVNLYGYVGQNPVNWTDPSGLLQYDFEEWFYREVGLLFSGVGKDVAEDAAEYAPEAAVAIPIIAATRNPQAARVGALAVREAVERAVLILAEQTGNLCRSGMAAAGTPIGQTVLNETPDFISAQIPDPNNAPPTQSSPGAIAGWFFSRISSIFLGGKNE